MSGNISDTRAWVEPVIQQVHLPAGMAGPVALTFDVRCFLLRDSHGLVLIDAGLKESFVEIERALARIGAQWQDIRDVVITHSHPDHVGGLDEVAARAVGATMWAGAADLHEIPSIRPIQPLSDGEQLNGLKVIHTPGHTKGHISLLHQDEGILFVGDAVGVTAGVMTRPPAPFTADAAEAERSLRTLSELAPGRMLFSHGPEIDDAVTQLRGLVEAGF